MAVTRTFSIIKPDATRRNITGAVTKMLEEAGLRVVASKRIRMTKEQAEGFYAVHKERPFFGELVEFMTSGPCVVQVLEGENAMQANRDIMGATNPADAAPGTIRKELAESLGWDLKALKQHRCLLDVLLGKDRNNPERRIEGNYKVEKKNCAAAAHGPGACAKHLDDVVGEVNGTRGEIQRIWYRELDRLR